MLVHRHLYSVAIEPPFRHWDFDQLAFASLFWHNGRDRQRNKRRACTVGPPYPANSTILFYVVLRRLYVDAAKPSFRHWGFNVLTSAMLL